MPTLTEEPIEIIRQAPPDEIQDMLGNPPGWLLRSGITMAFMVLCIGLALTWLIRYPDKMEAPVLLQSEYPPTEVLASGMQRIATIEVQDRQAVQQGQLLAIYENPADWAAVQQAIAFQEELPKALATKNVLELQTPSYLALGTLQNSYSNLLQSVQALQYFLQQGDVKAQVAALDQEIQRMEAMADYAQKEEQLSAQELVLVQKNLERTQALHQNGLSSTIELEQKEAAALQQQRQLEQVQSSAIQNQIRQEQLAAQQEQLQRDHYKEHSRLRLTVQQQLEQWQGEVATWKQRYLLLAPIAGQVAFAPELNPQRYVQAGELLLTLLPRQEAGRIVAHCYLPASGVGKIGQGASMQIKLDAYPAKEFGILTTTVENMALIPQTSTEGILLYHTTALLSDTLTTTYQRQIPFQQKLTGTAVVLTEDKRLLERLFEQLTDLFKNS